jgi:hypothetical protein
MLRRHNGMLKNKMRKQKCKCNCERNIKIQFFNIKIQFIDITKHGTNNKIYNLECKIQTLILAVITLHSEKLSVCAKL